MARLPTVQDLGPTPGAGGSRPVGTYDATPLAAGAAAIAKGVTTFGKGVSDLGEAGMAMDIVQQHADITNAQAEFLSKRIDLKSTYSDDQDYASLPERFGKDLVAARDEAAARIASPAARERFLQSVKPQVSESTAAIENQASKLHASYSTAYVQDQGNKFINQGVANPHDVELHAQIADTYGSQVDALVARGFVTPEQGLAMKQDFAHRFATADITSAIDSGDRGEIMGAMNRLRAAPGSNDQVTNRILRVEGYGKNGASSASGAGQFVDATWLDVLKRNRPDLAQGRSDKDLLALKADRTLGAEMTEAYRAENEKFLKSRGLPTDAGSQYLAHFLGPGGAAAVLKADPKKPVVDVLTEAVGEKQAQAMIRANPTILNGQLAGSVVGWSHRLMGGVGPGGGDLADMIRPDVRVALLSRGTEALHKETTNDIAGFHSSVQDDVAEAMRTGLVQKPKTQEDFVRAYGYGAAPAQFEQYRANLQLGADRQQVAAMTPQQQSELVRSYEPKPGEGYAEGIKRQGILAKAIQQTAKEREEDPAAYAVRYLPAVKDSFAALAHGMNDPTASPEAKQGLARDYATKTTMEQQRLGIAPENIRIAPQGYIDSLNSSITGAATSDDAQARVGLIARVQREAQMWGDNWPKVMAQLAPESVPLVRAIGASTDPSLPPSTIATATTALTRLLNLGKDENPAKLLKEQNETKAKDLRTSLNNEMEPFKQTLVDRQRDRDFAGYYDMTEKLAALYVRDGKDAATAASDAFKALIGNRYEFRDTYRVPKVQGVSADDVQAGAFVAKSMIGVAPAIQSNLGQATKDLNLTPQEQALYQRHLTNLTGPGGVDNADGSRSTLYQSSVEHDGKTYNIPTVWNGKILSIDDAVKRVQAEGWDKFPSYANEAEAETRYQKMHDYMERDTGQFIGARKSNPMSGVKPAIDDMGGLSDAAGDSLSKFKRDGVWVTSADNSGLNLMYGNKFVRQQDGRPLFMSWAQLQKLGGTPEARDEAMRRATEYSSQTP